MSQFVEQPREPLRPLVDTPEAFDLCLDSLTSGTVLLRSTQNVLMVTGTGLKLIFSRFDVKDPVPG